MLSKTEMMFQDFDGVRRMLGIRSKKTILAAIDRTWHQTGRCPLAVLYRSALPARQHVIDKAAQMECPQYNAWLSDVRYTFTPYADRMAREWRDLSSMQRRRRLTELRKRYE